MTGYSLWEARLEPGWQPGLVLMEQLTLEKKKVHHTEVWKIYISQIQQKGTNIQNVNKPKG